MSKNRDNGEKGDGNKKCNGNKNGSEESAETSTFVFIQLDCCFVAMLKVKENEIKLAKVT